MCLPYSVLGVRRAAREQRDGLLGSRARLHRVDEQRHARIGQQLRRLVGERHLADQRVVVCLDGGMVPAHVVGSPELPELLTPGRQLPDQVG